MNKAMDIERWGIFELALTGPEVGNPFLDVTLQAEFRQGEQAFQVDGFYDGNGRFLIRFMPNQEGNWKYVTRSNAAELDGRSGQFNCIAPSPDNHGPVQVYNTYHFAYTDGTPYFPFGTTCYAWTHQGRELEEQTLATLAQTSFNKLRMCVFPKDYVYNKNEPEHYPFVRDAAGTHDFTRFNPAFFHHLEQRLADLARLGIEADLILFHPYDRWGYATMTPEEDFRYLRYVIARLAAFRHVWWSLANEYDFMLDDKPMALWDQFFQLVQEADPYGRLRSIHNGRIWYDHHKPWVTHVCVQSSAVKKATEWRDTYQKPIINDELEYEGNNPVGTWGCISAHEEVHRFWTMVTRGCYAGHGETYLHPEDILWWSKGGVLHGESEPRIAFLREILEAAPGGLEPMRHPSSTSWERISGSQNGAYRLFYFGEYQPSAWAMGLPENVPFTVDLIDPWNMTITRLPGTFHNAAQIDLPGKPYLAVRIQPAA
ncbi:MAG: DUF5605 domain-containing protein [Anaerolineales bacterium]|nr:DUF5605 domain-containing protein [Anaerolineales bacterium]